MHEDSKNNPRKMLDSKFHPLLILVHYNIMVTGLNNSTYLIIIMINKALGELIPVGGGDNIPLLKTILIIGRRPSCDISLPYPNVSSHHCKLSLLNGYWFFEDLNSSNGIKVNGERCESRFLLPNDEITIAKHRFTINYEPVGELPELTLENPFSKSLMEKAGLEKKPKSREHAMDDSPAINKSVERPKSAPGTPNSKKKVDDQIQEWLE